MWEIMQRLIWDTGGPRGKCLLLVHVGKNGVPTHTVALSMSMWKSYAKQMKRSKILNKSVS